MVKLYKCEICGGEYSKPKLSTHIKNLHNITSEDYYKTYVIKNPQFDNICCNKDCQNKTKFLNIFAGYREFCSNSCINKSQKIRTKIKQTMVDKYGAPSPLESIELRNKIQDTMKLKYGCDNPSNNEQLVNKRKNTFLERYNVENSFQINDFKEKSEHTCLKKYNTKNPNELSSIKQKIKESHLKKYGCHSSKLKETKMKVRNTFISKYGSLSWQSNESSIDKFHKTCMSKYGVVHHMKSKSFIEQFQKSFLEKYGETNPSHIKEFKDKRENTNLTKYGNINFSKTEIFRQKILQSTIERFKNSERFKDLVKIDFNISEYNGVGDYDTKYPFVCTKCGSRFYDHIMNGHVPRCQICYPINQGTSICEKEIFDFCNDICNINNDIIIEHDREILNGRELDIYMPSKKLAIEFNGLYWHNDSRCDRDYHISKTNECNKLGINLIHIYEDEWIEKSKIVKSIILSKLGKIQNKIYARNCNIQIVDSDTSNTFLIDNHLQGEISGSINIGLYHNEELISLMVIGKPRFNKRYDWEILRFCSKINCNCVGGLSKIFKYFLKETDSRSIITYADLRYGIGESYANIGFKFLQRSSPSFYYVKNGKRYNRLSFQKKLLENKLQIFDKQLTSWENMQLNGYDRIFDCGCNVFEYSI